MLPSLALPPPCVLTPAFSQLHFLTSCCLYFTFYPSQPCQRSFPQRVPFFWLVPIVRSPAPARPAQKHCVLPTTRSRTGSAPCWALLLLFLPKNGLVWPPLWRITDSNRWPPACKTGALPAELIPRLTFVGIDRFELSTSTLSVWRSNQLSYIPAQFHLFPHRNTETTEGRGKAPSSHSGRILLKGGIPAAPSGTATLLRLSPSH